MVGGCFSCNFKECRSHSLQWSFLQVLNTEYSEERHSNRVGHATLLQHTQNQQKRLFFSKVTQEPTLSAFRGLCKLKTLNIDLSFSPRSFFPTLFVRIHNAQKKTNYREMFSLPTLVSFACKQDIGIFFWYRIALCLFQGNYFQLPIDFVTIHGIKGEK